MTLGEKICSLRTERGLSQSDLAEALEVSRQSVSKWETDASVPDLDRLVSMSRLFGVSLDELVLGETKKEEAKEPAAEESAAPPVPPVSLVPPRHTQTAVMLFCTAGIMGLLGLFLLGGFGLILAIPFLLCGCVVLASRHHPGLWCLWTVAMSVILYLQAGTAISWDIIFLTFQYEPEWNYTRLAIGWCFVLVSLGLLVATAWQLRKEPWTHRIPEKAVVIGGLICLAAGKIFTRLFLADVITALPSNSMLPQFLFMGKDVLHFLLLTVLAVALARWLYRRRNLKTV